MEKTKLDHETEDWLIAFLSGELDEREEENVRVWLEASPENRNAYESLMKDYLRIRWVQENVQIREEQAKKIIFSSLKKKKESDALLRSGSFNSGVINCDIILFYSRG